MLKFGIVAGESSGDILAARLITEFRKQYPDTCFTGIGGPQMREAGCDCLYSIRDLSVMGISEVVRKLPSLLKIRKSLVRYFLDNPPDVFIGVDFPDFNFSVERKLQQAGIKTAHYVSPSVWAWRESRLRSIARSTGLMLTIFPFESIYYRKYNIPVKYTGHPLADEIGLITDKTTYRRQLGLPVDRTIIAIMPGSRRNELVRHLPPFLEAASRLNSDKRGLCFISNLVSDSDKSYMQECIDNYSNGLECRLFTGKSVPVMASADLVLLASGTVALEAMLLKRPMVVAYKVNWFTYQVARRLIRLPYVSLPNVLAREKVVPECLQYQCNSENIYNELKDWMDNKTRIENTEIIFTNLHKEMLSSQRENLVSVLHDYAIKQV